MSITTTSSLPPPVQQWFDDVLLSRPEPLLIHNKMGMKKRLPSRSGTTVRYRRLNNLARATVPLGPNGITPPPQSLSALDIDAKVDFYGTYVIITDQVTIQNQDPVLNETASLLAQSLRETDDELTRNMLEATASFVNCSGGANGRQNGLIAVLKSSLMDSKLLTDNAEDNEAQATWKLAA